MLTPTLNPLPVKPAAPTDGRFTSPKPIQPIQPVQPESPEAARILAVPPAQPPHPPLGDESANLRQNINDLIAIISETQTALEMSPNDGPARAMPSVALARMHELRILRKEKAVWLKSAHK